MAHQDDEVGVLEADSVESAESTGGQDAGHREEVGQTGEKNQEGGEHAHRFTPGLQVLRAAAGAAPQDPA